MMIDEFDNILKQFLSNLPQHSPKTDVWKNISASLDEDLAMGRIRKVLKKSERAPKRDLWPAIESSLIAPFFWKWLIRSNWVKIGLPSLVIFGVTLIVTPYLNSDKDSGIASYSVSENAAKNNVISDMIMTDLSKRTIVENENSEAPDLNITTIQKDDNIEAEKNNRDQLQNQTQNSTLDKEKNVSKNNTDLIIENIPETAVFNEKPIVTENNSSNVEASEHILSNQISVLPVSLLQTSSVDGLAFINAIRNGNSFNIPQRKWTGPADFSMDISYSPEFAFMNLRNNAADYNIDLGLRKKAEQYSYSWAAGLEGKLDFHHFFVQAGLNYSQTTSLSKYSFNYSGTDTVGWHLDSMYVYIYFDSLGYCHDSVSYVWSPVVKSYAYDEKHNPEYQISYLQIPVLAGYSISSGRFRYSLAGGVSFGIPIAASGRILEPDNKTISCISEKELPLSNLVYSGIVRLGLDYSITSKYSVFVQPSFKYNLNSIFEKSYPINQKYSIYSLRFGINFRF